MQDEYNYMVDALGVTPVLLETLLAGVTQAQAQAARGGDEGWNVVEVVCHLRDHEERMLERLRAMRDEDNPAIVPYNQEELARERQYAAQELRQALADWKRLRENHVALLAALAPADWGRTGRHPERGPITIGIQTLRLLCHDSIHAAQLARQIGHP